MSLKIGLNDLPFWEEQRALVRRIGEKNSPLPARRVALPINEISPERESSRKYEAKPKQAAFARAVGTGIVIPHPYHMF